MSKESFGNYIHSMEIDGHWWLINLKEGKISFYSDHKIALKIISIQS